MDRADLFRIYELGGTITPLQNLRDETSAADLFLALINAQTVLKELLGGDPQAKAELCLGDARNLLAHLDAVERAYFTDEEGKWKFPDGSAKVAQFQLWNIRSAAQAFVAVFRAEMQTAATYWVPKRGSFSTRDLVDAFDISFLPDVRSALDALALTEYRNAGRCFAFGLWTAAGYHCCRAVEAVLRSYYLALTGKEAVEGKSWGDWIAELERIDPKPDEKTMFYIRQLKNNERNPLMHVRVVLDEQDADLLLNSSKIAIVLMAREIQARHLSEQTLPIPFTANGSAVA